MSKIRSPSVAQRNSFQAKTVHALIEWSQPLPGHKRAEYKPDSILEHHEPEVLLQERVVGFMSQAAAELGRTTISDAHVLRTRCG